MNEFFNKLIDVIIEFEHESSEQSRLACHHNDTYDQILSAGKSIAYRRAAERLDDFLRDVCGEPLKHCPSTAADSAPL